MSVDPCMYFELSVTHPGLLRYAQLSLFWSHSDNNPDGHIFIFFCHSSIHFAGDVLKRAQLSMGAPSDIALEALGDDIATLTACVRSVSGNEEPCVLKRLPNNRLGEFEPYLTVGHFKWGPLCFALTRIFWFGIHKMISALSIRKRRGLRDYHLAVNLKFFHSAIMVNYLLYYPSIVNSRGAWEIRLFVCIFPGR